MPASIHWEVTNLPKASVKTVQCVRADVGIGPCRTSVNPCCLANFERKAFLPQTWNRNYSQIWCTVTGARRVSTCVRNIRKSDSCLNRTAGCTPRPQAPFSSLSFPVQGKRKGRRRHVGNGLDGTSPRAKRGVSYPLSPFPPFQSANASLVYVLGPGLDGTSPCGGKRISCTSRLFKVLSRKST